MMTGVVVESTRGDVTSSMSLRDGIGQTEERKRGGIDISLASVLVP